MRIAIAALGALLVAAAPAAAADVTTFGYGNARQASTSRTSITPSSARRMRRVWLSRTGGAIDSQVLVVSGVRAAGRTRRLVLAGDERGTVRALDARDGHVVWRHQLAKTKPIDPSCGASPDGRFGITGTMVADRAAGVVYAVTADGRAWALRLSDGGVLPGWPVRIHPAKGAEFVWSALSLSRGRLYVPVASLCDQGGAYDGGVAAIDLATRTVSRWSSTAGTGAFGGGIWAWAGASIDKGGDLFVATGNALGGADEDLGYAEHVVRLAPDLTVRQSNIPLKQPFVVGDRDFGSTPTLIDAKGCPHQLVVLNKIGVVYLYDREHIDRGPQQSLRVARPDAAPLINDAAYDPASRTIVFINPSTPRKGAFHKGIVAMRLNSSCRLATRWNRSWGVTAAPAPTIAGGVVWLATGYAGSLTGYAMRDGHRVFVQKLNSQASFGTPIVSGSTLYASDWNGRIWAFRPHHG